MGNTASTSNKEAFYDLVIPCSLSDLCSEGQGYWPLKVHKGIPLESFQGHIVGILGQYNKGKTWIMGRLSDCSLEKEGMVVRTQGISFKWVETYGSNDKVRYQHLVADTAGFHTPIALGTAATNPGNAGSSAQAATEDDAETKEKSFKVMATLMRETEIYEQFLTNLTLLISNYIIVVMNETTLPDQRFLFTVAEAWKQSRPESKKCTEIFVIHNFRYTTEVEERETLFKNSTEDILEGTVDDRNPLVKTFVCHKFNTRHICLMNDECVVGKQYNNNAFQQIKSWIHNMLPIPQRPHTEESLAVEFAKTCTELLNSRGLLVNVQEMRLQTIDDGSKCYKPVKKNADDPITIATSEDDKYYGLLAPFKPMYNVIQYQAKSGKLCKLIRLEVPGVKEVRVKKQDKAGLKLNHWAVEVTGNKVRTDYGISELRELEAVNTKPDICPADDDKIATREPDADHCRYGEFHEMFPIFMGFKRKVTRIGPINGIFYAIFQEEEDGDFDS